MADITLKREAKIISHIQPSPQKKSRTWNQVGKWIEVNTPQEYRGLARNLDEQTASPLPPVPKMSFVFL